VAQDSGAVAAALGNMIFGKVAEGKISIFYGKMGSGKTTNAMSQVMDFWNKGKPVWVNFPISKLPKKKGEESPIYFEDDPEGILSMREGLYVIDEAYLKLNSRNWANLPPAVFVAFTHVRKLHMTVIVIAQSWMRIDKSIREVSTFAREFHGGKVFGKLYDFTEYQIDEMGDIIKGVPVEYQSAKGGFSLIRKSVYDAFDTDFMFGNPPARDWKSAIGYGQYRGASPPAARSPQPAAAMLTTPPEAPKPA